MSCFGVAAGVATALLIAFVLLPVLAMFLRVSPGRLVSALHSRVALDALAVSVKTSLIAVALILVVGTPTAYVLATTNLRGRGLILSLLELPLVLPPAVAGIGLFAAFGRFGTLGGVLRAVGSRSRSRRSRSSWRSRSSRARSTCARRMRRSRRSTLSSSGLRERSEPGPAAPSGGLACPWRAQG